MASPLFRIHDSNWWAGRAVQKNCQFKNGGVESTELLFSQKIAQVLVEADQRAHSWII
jgi:hypothetical protein